MLPGEQRNDEQARPISRRTDGTGHWLMLKHGEIAGCHCGFAADPDDEGYGDRVVDHIADVAASEVRAELAAARRTLDEIRDVLNDWASDEGESIKLVTLPARIDAILTRPSSSLTDTRNEEKRA